MENPLLSVVVPVYNVENYLRRCIESLLRQTYSPLEIILVNDGSCDGCPTICDEYAEKYTNITVIHKENGGLSSARNAGIVKASGEYITFVDSDDWVADDTYEFSMRQIFENGADCFQFDFKRVYGEEIVKQPEEKNRIFCGKDIMQHYMDESTRTGSYSVWRTVFPRKKIEHLRFREGKINEDIDYKYKALSCCMKLVVSNQRKYFYFQSRESLSCGGLKKRDLDLYEAADKLCELTESEDYGSIRFLGRVKKARTAFSLLSKIAYYGIDDKDIEERAMVKRLKAEHKKNVRTLIKAPISFGRKVLALCYCVSFNFSKAMIRVAKVLAVRESN